ncbi:hypothetical protein AVEN_550-1 [Araneus ventricosus]|uniref:Integrase catalytic domain-containing protein n=1 Tax=Araneus ventricosus TaxID=182803 RepID=A0A4Y2I7Z3_ARAVE|nr:hypothetical protein AVEN_550-1 [Araneus ventricosus]
MAATEEMKIENDDIFSFPPKEEFEGLSVLKIDSKSLSKLNKAEIEEYVRSCDHCQRVGKPNDKKRAPMKLVPIIQEVFAKINVDAVGPLPITASGKKYLITAMCLASKYPDAVAVSDITSMSVVDALLQIFSRMGFPKEIQHDQGTSFMRELTTEFFERFGVRVVHSSTYHPQSNPFERFQHSWMNTSCFLFRRRPRLG